MTVSRLSRGPKTTTRAIMTTAAIANFFHPNLMREDLLPSLASSTRLYPFTRGKMLLLIEAPFLLVGF